MLTAPGFAASCSTPKRTPGREARLELRSIGGGVALHARPAKSSEGVPAKPPKPGYCE